MKLAFTFAAREGKAARRHIVTFENAFHGRTLGAQLAGGSPSLKDWIPGRHPEYVQVPFPDGFRTADTSFELFEQSLAEARGRGGFGLRRDDGDVSGLQRPDVPGRLRAEVAPMV